MNKVLTDSKPKGIFRGKRVHTECIGYERPPKSVDLGKLSKQQLDSFYEKTRVDCSKRNSNMRRLSLV